MFWEIVGIVAAVAVVLVIGFLLGIVYRKKVAEREISSGGGGQADHQRVHQGRREQEA